MASDKDAAAAAAAAAEKARKDAEAARARHDAAEKNRKSLDDAIAKWRAKVEELEKAVAECKKRVAEKTAILEKLLKEEPGQSSAVAAEQKKAKQDPPPLEWALLGVRLVARDCRMRVRPPLQAHTLKHLDPPSSWGPAWLAQWPDWPRAQNPT